MELGESDSESDCGATCGRAFRATGGGGQGNFNGRSGGVVGNQRPASPEYSPLDDDGANSVASGNEMEDDR